LERLCVTLIVLLVLSALVQAATTVIYFRDTATRTHYIEGQIDVLTEIIEAIQESRGN